MKKLLMSTALITALVTFSMPALAQQTTTDENGCTVNVQKDSGETTRICKDSVTIGGPIKDVTIATPLGGENAAIPKAGRDIEAVAQGIGKALGF